MIENRIDDVSFWSGTRDPGSLLYDEYLITLHQKII
jgi:hypothetical protein